MTKLCVDYVGFLFLAHPVRLSRCSFKSILLFCFSMESSHFWPPSLHVALYKTLFFDFWLRLLKPKIDSPKFELKSPISQFVWQIDRRRGSLNVMADWFFELCAPPERDNTIWGKCALCVASLRAARRVVICHVICLKHVPPPLLVLRQQNSSTFTTQPLNQELNSVLRSHDAKSYFYKIKFFHYLIGPLLYSYSSPRVIA